MGGKIRQSITGKNCWFVPQALKNYESDAAGQYIPGRRFEMKFTSGGLNYSVQLQPLSTDSSDWHGTYSTRLGSVPVTAKLYAATDGCMVLVGQWPETGSIYTWLVRFESDDAEEDEDSGGRGGR
jgi:hypothetical protein